jgi:EAL and modified HD-GYP domain-containing signal transduction protein
MFEFIKRLFGGAPRKSAGDRDFAALNRQAPIRPERGQTAPDSAGEGFVCRETILGRDQRVAGYHFLLHQATRARLASRSRRIHHVYAEVLVRNLIKIDVGRLLGHRLAFFEVPDSFLDHEALTLLPPENAVMALVALPDPDGPTPAQVIEQVRALRARGYRFAVNAMSQEAPGAYLLAEADFVIVRADQADPKRLRDFTEALSRADHRRQWLARELPSHDEFKLCFNLGAELFQGPFVTRREDWSNNTLGPNSARIADLLSRLRRDVDTREIAEVLKRDPALSLRLIRYINSASIGLREEITSIERALMQLGREKLYRWLTLLLYGADSRNPASSALLESALVRARMLEILGEGRPTEARDALFLVGLLSLVDAVLQVPMQVALTQLAASPEIEAAVARGEGEMAHLLALAIACEGNDAGAVMAAAERCGVVAEAANAAHVQALAWALEVTRQ